MNKETVEKIDKIIDLIGKDIDIKFSNVLFVYNKENNILFFTTEKYLQRYLDMGFIIISDEDARKMPEFQLLKDKIQEESKSKEKELKYNDFKDELDKEEFKRILEEEQAKPDKYKEKDMVIMPADDEDWLDPDYNHGHPKK